MDSTSLLYATEIVRGLFGPSVEPVISSHTCSHNLHSGRLYIASNALCFYSNIFGFERRLLIPILDITFTGTIRVTSIKIRTKSNRHSNINGTTCLDNGEVKNGDDEFDEDENNTTDADTDDDSSPPMCHSRAIVVGGDDEEKEGEPINTQRRANGNITVAENQPKPSPRRQKLLEEDSKQKVVIEECEKEVTRGRQQEGERVTTETSEVEYVFKSFEDRDSVLKILSALRAKASKNSAIVRPHHQNEGGVPLFQQIGAGNFCNISLPQRMATFSGKLRGEITNSTNERNHTIVNTDTKEKKKTKTGKNKTKKRCKSVPPRSESREKINYSVNSMSDDIRGPLDFTKDDNENNKRNVVADKNVPPQSESQKNMHDSTKYSDPRDNNDDSKGDDADVVQTRPSSPVPNRWRCFTAPDWKTDRSIMCSSPGRSRTSSAESSAEHTPINPIGLSYPLYQEDDTSAKVTMRPPTLSPSTPILPDASLPSPPPSLKTACTPSDWVKVKEMFKDYSEIAVKPQSLPRSTCESLDAFYDLFLADRAPNSIPKFQENIIGDTSMTIQLWQQQQQDHLKERCTTASSLSFPLLQAGGLQQQRALTFSHPRNATLGPSNVHTTKTHICQRFDPCGLILHSNTVVKDVPYSDCFVVEEIWIVESTQGSSSNGNDIVLSVRFRIRFVKSTMFKKLIINQVRTEVSSWYQSYEKMVMSSLKPKNANVKQDCRNDHDDHTIKNNNIEVEEVKEIEQKQHLSRGLEIRKKEVGIDTSSPLLPLASLESTVEEDKRCNTEISLSWTRVCLQAQKNLTPSTCLILLLLWMIFHILCLNQKVESMEEELKVIKIENAFVLQTLMNAVSINNTS